MMFKFANQMICSAVVFVMPGFVMTANAGDSKPFDIEKCVELERDIFCVTWTMDVLCNRLSELPPNRLFLIAATVDHLKIEMANMKDLEKRFTSLHWQHIPPDTLSRVRAVTFHESYAGKLTRIANETVATQHQTILLLHGLAKVHLDRAKLIRSAD